MQGVARGSTDLKSLRITDLENNAAADVTPTHGTALQPTREGGICSWTIIFQYTNSWIYITGIYIEWHICSKQELWSQRNSRCY
jgi:hypothetical protein